LKRIVLPLRALKSRSSEFAGAHLAQRKETESPLEAFAFDWNLQMLHARGLVLFAGIEYIQINEKFEKIDVTENTVTTIGVTAIIENALGQVIDTETGPQTITTTITRINRIYNRHRFYNIPIGVGVHWSKNKNHFKFLGGVNYNLAYRFSGGLLNENLNISSFRNGTLQNYYNQVFRPRIGWGLWISGEISRPINRQLRWVIAPKIQIPLKSLTQSEYRLVHRYNMISLKMGVNYLFNPVKKTRPRN